jgi:hypothetical protein
MRPDTGGDNSYQGAPTGQPLSRWLIAAFLAVGLGIIVMLRYAIDLLAVVCIVWLLGWAVRSVGDWGGSGGGGGAWTISAIVLTVAGAALILDWLTSAHVLTPRVAPYVPTTVHRVYASAESSGWGRRAWFTPTGMGAQAGGGAGPSAPRPSSPSSPDAPPPGTASTPAPMSGGATGGPEMRQGETHRTTTTIASSAPAASVGSAVEFTAVVSSRSGGRPQGSVVFRRGASVLGVAPLGSDGRASVTTRGLPPGTHVITAEFTGAGSFGRSSAALSQQITR